MASEGRRLYGNGMPELRKGESAWYRKSICIDNSFRDCSALLDSKVRSSVL